MNITASFLIKALAVYSVITLTVVSSTVLLFSDSADDHAVIKMMLGLVVLWILVFGSLMYIFKEPLSDFVRSLPGNWKMKFVFFAILLALIEEAITTGMTNLAPLFGSEIGEAFITASANYLHVITFHSVIVFIPMFIVWAFLLERYAFTPEQVFLLFGLTGSLAEAGMDPTNIFGGFWFFVYGLMIYLPARSIPRLTDRTRPKIQHHILAVTLPFVAAAVFSVFVIFARTYFEIPLFEGV